MKWPWTKDPPAPRRVYVPADHAASHEAAQILERARTELMREGQYCKAAWGVLFDAQGHVEKACHERLWR